MQIPTPIINWMSRETINDIIGTHPHRTPLSLNGCKSSDSSQFTNLKSVTSIASMSTMYYLELGILVLWGRQMTDLK